MSVYAAQYMKKLGLRLVQGYSGTDRDVLVCKKTGVVIDLAEENHILVIPVTKRQATDLSRMPGIQELVEDIAAGLVSPLVPVSMKSYTRRGSSSGNFPTLGAQIDQMAASTLRKSSRRVGWSDDQGNGRKGRTEGF